MVPLLAWCTDPCLCLLYQIARQKVENALGKITQSKNKLAYEKGKLQV